MNWIIYISLISWIFIIKSKCQLSDNTPPIMYLDSRRWQIPETEIIGSRITQVHGSDNEGGPLFYGLEPSQPYGSKSPVEKLPFTIDRNNGIVYLNESLKGRAGQNIVLYVTVSDGELTAKSEVWVNIVNSTTFIPSSNPFASGKSGVRPPNFLNLGFNTRPSPPPLPSPPVPPNGASSSIPNNSPPLSKQPQFHPKPPQPPAEPQSAESPLQNETTHLKPILVDVQNNIENKRKIFESTTSPKTTEQKIEEDEQNQNLLLPLPVDKPLKSSPDLTVTMIPIISICGIFLTVGIIASVFRKKICLAKAKVSKDEMRKESSGANVLQENPTGMQQWRGPIGFSNRYEPWDNSNHSQINHQISGPIKDPDFWEFPRHRLKFFNILGEGAFGQVWKCEATNIKGNEGVSIVAVKTLKENANEREKTDLISELQVMKMLEPHPNVVRLLGCCTEKEPIFVIMEYISKGKLQSYLRNSRAERYYNNMHGQSKSLTSRDLTSFAYQTARGMEFLSANGIIHRDLAARNVLITDEHTCKVADFGFARDVTTSHVYERKSEGRLPIRWMAPESLYDNIFSVKSDVWSFGVLIWEIVTLGSTPYPGLSAAEVMKKVRDGYRLEKPEHCRRELYNIMYYCWDKDPSQRPSFSECVELLEKLLMTETDYIELERFPDHSYYNMMSLSGEKL